MAWKKTDDLSKFGILLTTDTKKIPLGKTNDPYQIYRIPLEKLKYNSNNGRIFMEMIKLNSGGEVNIKELEKTDVEQYNSEIEKLIWDSDPEKNNTTMEDIKTWTQLEAGVVLDDGTVIDGNRRFTCLRMLHRKYPDNKDFKYLNAAIIFREGNSISQKDIKSYELRVQFGRDEKVDYKAVNFAMSIYKEIKSEEFTIQEIADNVNKKRSEITKIVNTCELVEEFLNFYGRPGQLYVAEELNIYWPLEPLAAYLNGPDAKNLTELQKNKRKNLFFKYMIAIDSPLPTQEFRDNLIKKIFKDDVLCEELIEQFDSKFGESVNKNLIENKDEPEKFVQKVKDFKKSDISKSIQKDYKNKVNKKNMQDQANAPVEICEDVIDRLKQIDLKPFIKSSSSTADDKLRKVHGHLKSSSQIIEGLIEEIENKLKFND